MVAFRGQGWALAPSLVVLHEQINHLHPARDRTSDGSIGDLAHQARTSDHNPDSSGIVRALDTDEDYVRTGDLEPARAMVEAIRASRDPRLKYLIYEGQLFSSYSTSSRAAWQWGPYSGSNPHDRHWHLSIVAGISAANDTRPWTITKETDMKDERISDAEAATVRQLHAAIEAKDSHGSALAFLIDDARKDIVTMDELNEILDKRLAGGGKASKNQVLAWVAEAIANG